MMWGSDYPHSEASFPFTREHFRLTFGQMDPAEVQQIVGGNAASLYGFDLSRLTPIAARVGPSVVDTQRPLAAADVPADAKKCPGFVV
jgi:hypothetical protein